MSERDREEGATVLVIGAAARIGKLHVVDTNTGLTLCGRDDATSTQQFAKWDVRETVAHRDGCARCRRELAKAAAAAERMGQ